MMLSKASLAVSPAARSQYVARVGCARFVSLVRRSPTVVRAQGGTESDDDSCNYIASDYCGIDPVTGKKAARRTVGEMEQEFLAALGSYYYEGKAIMPDDEFNLLKEELIWSGSKVAVLDSDEQKFLEATIAFSKGTKLLEDEEYDRLKSALKQKGSIVAAEGPRCSIRTKKMYSDANPDYTKMTLLNLPATLVILGLVFSIDFLSDFKISTAMEQPAPVGPLLISLILPGCFVIANAITNVAFNKSIILKGPCPNCGEENFSFFGEVLTVPGNRGQNTCDCVKCNALLTFDEYKRIIVVSETPEEREKKAAAAAAALAAKKATAAKKAATAAAAAKEEAKSS